MFFWGVLWVDEMTRLLYLLLRPSLSADLEIMANSTPPPPLLLLRSSASLLEAQQRGTSHHFPSSSEQGQAHGQSLLSVGRIGSALLVFNLKGFWLFRQAVALSGEKWQVNNHIQLTNFCPQGSAGENCQQKQVKM